MDILDTYQKDRVHPSGWGYGLRRSGPIQSVIVHATHGHPGSRLTNEATFLMSSREVSAHYLIGREGQILRILPDAWNAWHAGRVLAPFRNDVSIGIELHAAVSEAITPAQRSSLQWLLRQLMAQYHIPQTLIDTHRAVAVPSGRKSDPATWSQASFVAWKDAL